MTIALPLALGFITSLIGITPPGLINMTAAKVSIEEGRTRAFVFAGGATFIILIQTFLAGVKEQWVAQKAVAFKSQAWARLMRPQGVISVKQELASGAEVTICSASPALVLKPFAEQLGIKLIGTELEVIDGVLTGRISGDN